MAEYHTLEEFALYVHKQAHSITSRLTYGHTADALKLASALTTDAWTVLQQAKMQEERSTLETLDFSTLPPITPNSDPE